LTFLAHLPDVRPLLEPIGGRVNILGVEGSLGVHQGGRRASGRKGSSGAFREGIYLAWGPAGEIGGAAPASPIASDFADGQSNNIGV
jgi:hypothetical protein